MSIGPLRTNLSEILIKILIKIQNLSGGGVLKQTAQDDDIFHHNIDVT